MHPYFHRIKSLLLKSTLFTSIIFIFFSQQTISQPDPVKWGKVSDEELKLKVCSFDSAAAAVVLFDYGKVRDRKSTRLNSSHANISYAVFCLKKKKQAT